MKQARDALPGATIPTAIAAAARRDPAAPALVSASGTTTYGQFVRAIDGYASALAARGLRPGMPAGLVLGDAPVDLTMFLALFRLGVRTMVVSPQESPAERNAVLGLIEAEVCVGAAAHRPADGHGWIDFESLDADAHPVGPGALPGPEDVAEYNRSSGTTLGERKIVGITHGQRADRAVRTGSEFISGSSDRMLAVVTLSNVFGRSTLMSVLVRGGAVVFRSADLKLGSMREWVAAKGVTAMALTPPFVRDMLRHRADGPLLPGVRLLVGSAPLFPAERQQVRERLTPQLFIQYATNESGVLAIATPDDLASDPLCAGRPVPGIEAEAVDDDLRPLPPGTLGELRFRDPGFPTAYTVTVPGQTSRFAGGWFYPGDAGSIDAAGRIALHGRIDDVINVGGRKVHPSAIEAWLAADPRVAEAAAVAVPADRLGQVPVGAVVLREPVTEEELLALCRRGAGVGIPMPRRVVALPQLPRNAAGKVDRRALLALLHRRLVDRKDTPSP